ncbi:putative RNA-binding protein [Plasmodium gaboni]|uniref:Putative RNA-binding protein n=1 Tax=Plasmodium gaboni TaxID=647221 RepID=A0A151LUJ7_9APIC|nr:putative RNA-binding protein [Plasmodium gaboni]KYO02852.1 putative RNA-binding protein [Plasmodium gaboni]
MNETKEDTSDRADEVSLENLSFEKLSFEKLSSEKDSSEKDSSEKDSLEKDSLEKDSLEKDSLEKDSLEKDSLEKPSSEKPSSEKPSSKKPSSDKEEDEKKNAVKNKNLKKSNKKIIKKNKKKGKLKKNNTKENQTATTISNNDHNKNNHVCSNKSNNPMIIPSHIPPPPPTSKPPPPPPPKEKNQIEKWTLRKNSTYSIRTNIDLHTTTNGNLISNNNFSNILITNQNNNHNIQHIINNTNRNIQNDNINNIAIHSTGSLSIGNNQIVGKPTLTPKTINNQWNINNNYNKKGEHNINVKKLSSVDLKVSTNYNINANNKKNDIINNNMMYYNITNNIIDKDKYKNHIQIRHASYYQNRNPINLIKEQEDKNKKNTLLPNSNINQINTDPIYYMNKSSYEYNIKGNVIYPPKFPALSNISSTRPYMLKAPPELVLIFLALPKTSSKILKKNAGGFPSYSKEAPPPNHFSSRKLSEPIINMCPTNMKCLPPVPGSFHESKMVPMKYHPYESHVDNMKYSYKAKGNKMNTPMSDKKPHNIIVTNIPKDLSAQEIMETFKCVGNVLGADIMLTSKGTHSGRACITFPDFESASLAASQYDGGTLNNQKIKVFLE